MSYVEKNGKFNVKKWNRENVYLEEEVLKENYIKDIEQDGEVGAGIGLIIDRWKEWTKSSDIGGSERKAAKKELMIYINKWLNKEIK